MTSGNASTGDTSPPHHRVLLVDDHTFFRAGTRRILEDQPDFVVVGEAGNGVDTLALLETCDPEVVVLDINLPGMGGIALCEAIRQARP
jgi:DNA-binding NarL/FixJ family response regulator